MPRYRVMALAAVVASCSLAVALTSLDAAGEPPKAETFTTTVSKGTALYAAKDYPGAIAAFEKAVQASPRNPLGPYLLGEAYLASGKLGEAEAAFKTAADLDDPKTPPASRSRALFALADCYEREKKWEQATAAWRAYAEHASKLAADAGAHPESAAARMKAIEEAGRVEKIAEVTRARIAAEKSDAGAPAPGK